MLELTLHNLKTRLLEESKEILKKEDIELVELVIRGNPNSPLIQFFVDRNSGITVDDCAELSRMISDVLDSLEDLELKSYRLDVSSPGLDRLLVTARDFRKNIGREVTMTIKDNERIQKLQGVITRVNGMSIYLDVNNNNIGVSTSSIIKAKIKLKW